MTASKGFYLRAINFICKNIKNPIFYIFTDDIDWVNKHFVMKKNFIIVQNNFGSNSYQDMYLMSKASQLVIANSSYSWWGAYLNADGRIYAPDRWYVDAVIDLGDFFPGHWTMVPSGPASNTI